MAYAVQYGGILEWFQASTYQAALQGDTAKVAECMPMVPIWRTLPLNICLAKQERESAPLQAPAGISRRMVWRTMILPYGGGSTHPPSPTTIESGTIRSERALHPLRGP